MKKIVIGIPCHRRLNILKVQISYYQDILYPFLSQNGFDVTFFYVGTDELEEQEIPNTSCFVYEKRPDNILSAKFNRLISFAKEKDFDYLMTMGSDDLISPGLFMKMVEIADDNKYISAPSQMLMYDTSRRKVFVWKGYNGKRILDLGAGRVYTRKLLSILPDYPFGNTLNKNCEEGTIDPKISTAIFNESKINIRTIKTTASLDYCDYLLSLKDTSALNTIDTFLRLNLVENECFDIKDQEIFHWLNDDIIAKITNL
jgi:hypothetical protein